MVHGNALIRVQLVRFKNGCAADRANEQSRLMRLEAQMSEASNGSQAVDERIEGLGDWRGAMLSRLRALIREADRDVTEGVKWRKPSNPAGVPVWEDCGLICTGETYK